MRGGVMSVLLAGASVEEEEEEEEDVVVVVEEELPAGASPASLSCACSMRSSSMASRAVSAAPMATK